MMMIVDAMAGVGPFAVPAAKKGCKVYVVFVQFSSSKILLLTNHYFRYANDLNPESFKWLQVNSKLNKVDRTMIASNLDGRAFLRTVVAPLLSYVFLLLDVPRFWWWK
jgi:tRNA (guanine37-N1)-methyltransferase